MATKRYARLSEAVKGVTGRALQGVDNGYKRALNEARAELRVVVQDWKSDVDFAVLPTRSKTAYTYEVKAIGPDLQIFIYVDEGTVPHIIRPKKPGGRLAFQTGYSARTAPIAQYGVGTGKKFGPKVFRTEVHHPGNEARQFTKVILGRAISKLKQYVREETDKI